MDSESRENTSPESGSAEENENNTKSKKNKSDSQRKVKSGKSFATVDSLAAMRPPSHRTPNETRKKKRVTS
jgi:hypothetical protein